MRDIQCLENYVDTVVLLTGLPDRFITYHFKFKVPIYQRNVLLNELYSTYTFIEQNRIYESQKCGKSSFSWKEDKEKASFNMITFIYGSVTVILFAKKKWKKTKMNKNLLLLSIIT